MLTVKKIEAATFGKSPVRLSDGNGLYVRLNKGGTKVFQLRLTLHGRTKWITLGHFPELSLKDARVQAILKREEVEGASDVGQTNSTNSSPTVLPDQRKTPLFRDFAKTWFEQKKQGLSNGKHIQQNWSTLTTYVFPHIGHLPLDQIRNRQILDTFRPIWFEKQETAKRTLGRVREVFELAIIEEFMETNPAAFSTKVAFGRVTRRVRHQPSLDWERMPDLWEWLLHHPVEEDVRCLMMTLVLSAKRTKEARFLEWQDLDFETMTWTSQSEHMKMRKEHQVPISKQLNVVFENMRFLTGDTEQVFHRPKNKLKVIDENCARIEFQKFDPGITGHGMRASFRTWARKQGKYPKDLMEMALAHEKDSLTQAYERDPLLEERRPMMQDWADFVTKGQLPHRLADLIS